MVLRFVVSTNDQPVKPSRVTNSIEWSALPKTFLQARQTFEALKELKLVKKQGNDAYTFTKLGEKVLATGHKKGMWVGTNGKKPDSRRNTK